MQGISRELFRLLANSGIAKKYYDQLAIKAWDKVVGQEIADHCRPKEVKGSVMFVVCAHAIWAQELSMRKKNIIDEIKNIVGKSYIKEIKFTTGELPQVQDNQNGISSAFKETLPELNQEELTWVRSQLNEIEDDQLKYKLENIMIYDLRKKKQQKREGYRECSRCGILTQNSNVCSFCKEEKKRLELNQILRLLKDTPWLDYQAMQYYRPDTKKVDFHRAKTMLYWKIKDKLAWIKKTQTHHPKESNQAWMEDLLNQLVLLVMERPPEELPSGAWEKIVEANCPEYFKLFNISKKEDE